MRLGIGLALALLCACAAAKSRPPPRDAPLDETKTYGPSRVIYWR